MTSKQCCVVGAIVKVAKLSLDLYPYKAPIQRERTLYSEHVPDKYWFETEEIGYEACVRCTCSSPSVA
jgi:hypothetical protein